MKFSGAVALALVLFLERLCPTLSTPMTCTDTRRRLLLHSPEEKDFLEDLLVECSGATYALHSFVSDDPIEALLILTPSNDASKSCPDLGIESEPETGEIFLFALEDDYNDDLEKTPVTTPSKGKQVASTKLKQVLEAFEKASSDDKNEQVQWPLGTNWCKSGLTRVLQELNYAGDMQDLEALFCAWTVLLPEINDNLYEKIQSDCGTEPYDFTFYHYGEHLYFVTFPSDTMGASGCPTLVLHDNGKETAEEGGTKQMVVVNNGSPFLASRGHFLATLPLTKILFAYETSLVREGGFEIVLSNCATFILSMMQILELDPNDEFVEFAADQLASNEKTIKRLLGSENLSQLIGDAEPDIEEKELLRQLGSHYIKEMYYGRNLRGDVTAGQNQRKTQSVCSLCAGGLDPQAPDLHKVLFQRDVCDGGQQVTCALLAVEALAYTQADVDNGNCAGLQALGSIYCGCPEQPTLTCNVCPDGSLPPREFMEEATTGCPTCSRDPFGFSDPCRDLVLKAAETTDAASCENLQRFSLGDCGCPIPNPGACDLCSGGVADIPDLSKMLSSTVDCEGMVRLAGGAPNPLFCQAYQTVAGEYCDCANYDINTETNVCRLCGDRTPLPDTRWGILANEVGLGSTSCGFFEAVATVLTNAGQATCDVMRLAGAPCCESQPFCTFCADGEAPTVDLDAELPFLFADGTPATCRKLENVIVGLPPTEQGETSCRGWHEVTAQYCGCVSRDDVACPLCIDGSLPEDPDQTAMSNPVGLDSGPIEFHCSSLLRLSGALESADDPQCIRYQEDGLRQCRCPIPTEDVGNCPICEGGNSIIPDPNLEVLPNIDCDGLARYAATTSGKECEAYQAVAGLYCGCPEFSTGKGKGGRNNKKKKKKKNGQIDDVDGVCRICGEGIAIPMPSTFVEFQGFVLSCGELELTANIDDENQCFAYQEAGAQTCCSTGMPSKSNKSPGKQSMKKTKKKTKNKMNKMKGKGAMRKAIL